MPYSHHMRFRSFALILLIVSASAASPPSASSLEELKVVRVLHLKGKTYHVQGVDTDGKRLWVTSVDSPNRKGYLHEFSSTDGEILRSIEIQDAERFHPGGFASDAKPPGWK